MDDETAAERTERLLRVRKAPPPFGPVSPLAALASPAR